MNQSEILAQKIASGEYWLNETWFFFWLPLITIAFYVLIRLRYGLEWEWNPLLYTLVCNVALVLYHSPGDWDTIISGWINAISLPTNNTGIQITRHNFVAKYLEEIYLVLLFAVIYGTYRYGGGNEESNQQDKGVSGK